MAAILLIVRFEHVCAPNRPAVDRVPSEHLDGHDNRLVHLVACHAAYQEPLSPPRFHPTFSLASEELPLMKQHPHARNISSYDPDAGVIGQLSSCELEPQVKELLLKVPQPSLEIEIVQYVELGDLHGPTTASASSSRA